LVRPVPVVDPVHLPSEPSPSPPTVDEASGSSGSASSVEDRDDNDEEEPLIQMVECRICQEEDSVSNLETPCACSGSLK
ncbi:E3 ubiquitin-protein ligase MARCH3, partial [Trifolium medium]|nr:E3 ubiquitin-protein ligase MARCH3 [Trifolium medium]